MAAERENAMRAFLKRAGWSGAELIPLKGDASTRHYIRVRRNGRPAMLMDQPQSAETPTAPPDASPQERHALGYNAVARLAGADCGRFVAVAKHLQALGLSAPEIYEADTALGFVLTEDLGDQLYTDAIPSGANELGLYEAAAEVLASLHGQPAPTALSGNTRLYAYDDTALLAEIDLLTEWFIPVALGRNASEVEIDAHRELWRAALQGALKTPPVFVHRDYHAQNLMWLQERDGLRRVGVIDFQDAVAGPPAYDLISLTEDARRDVPPEIARATTRRYLDTRACQGQTLEEGAFRAQMAVMAAQRNAKIAGIFSRLHMRDGKSRYLGYLPRVWGHLNRDLENPALGELKRWYDETIPLSARTKKPVEHH